MVTFKKIVLIVSLISLPVMTIPHEYSLGADRATSLTDTQQLVCIYILKLQEIWFGSRETSWRCHSRTTCRCTLLAPAVFHLFGHFRGFGSEWLSGCFPRQVFLWNNLGCISYISEIKKLRVFPFLFHGEMRSSFGINLKDELLMKWRKEQRSSSLKCCQVAVNSEAVQH